MPSPESLHATQKFLKAQASHAQPRREAHNFSAGEPDLALSGERYEALAVAYAQLFGRVLVGPSVGVCAVTNTEKVSR